MNETKIMLPAAGSLTDFFTAISTLANEYQAAGNAVLIGIALLILGRKLGVENRFHILLSELQS